MNEFIIQWYSRSIFNFQPFEIKQLFKKIETKSKQLITNNLHQEFNNIYFYIIFNFSLLSISLTFFCKCFSLVICFNTILCILFSQYCVIMLDEVHERTLFTDILLGLLKKILKRRRDLRVIVCSATIDADHLHHFFNFNKTHDKQKDTVATIGIAGRNFSVDVHYLKGFPIFPLTCSWKSS